MHEVKDNVPAAAAPPPPPSPSSPSPSPPALSPPPDDGPGAPSAADASTPAAAPAAGAIADLEQRLAQLGVGTRRYVEALVNLTGAPVRLELMRRHEDMQGHGEARTVELPAATTDPVTLHVRADARLHFARSMPSLVKDNDEEAPTTTVGAYDMPDMGREVHLCMPRLARPLDRARCPGVIVPLAVALYLQRASEPQLARDLPLPNAAAAAAALRLPVYVPMPAGPDGRVHLFRWDAVL